ncbi:Signal transduction histidine kinase [Prevotella sp. ne3005]|uniref:sensor histidine kinase n=1 Tax=Prevotella sp. ne3005 TaxID=1761887 RepID=UPI0008D10FF9|nr:HAMP domain-containing sensor histidine kinase [Prevotella sp. ne3005]SEM46524.1 Signal transduction histidine kinase [Prevotella sp. ne3005]
MGTLLWIVNFVLLIGFAAALFFVHRYYSQQLKREVNRAQKSERLKSVFLDNASQTLRAPLNAILGYSNMILEEKNDTMDAVQVKQMAGHIQQSSQELLDFIKQLMDLSGFDGGMPSFTFIEVNLAELMASYRREAMNLTKANVSIRVRTDLSPHCKVTLDSNFMHQLMMHLLNNAAKHATQGEIVVTYTSERNGLKVMINYLGNGQADVISEDIFSYLQKDALKMNGDVNGLGLPISKAIIDAVGGELDIDTQDGRKTVAQFWFPCKMRDKHKRN